MEDGVTGDGIGERGGEGQHRRKALVRAGATIVLAWVLILGAFYPLPIGHESGLRALLRLGANIALVGVVFAWQIRRINVAELPELPEPRAIGALGIVVAVFLVAFSAIYLAMSHQSASTFTQPLDHTRALYFTFSIFATAAFGDITPKTDIARLVVSAQMLLDPVIIGASCDTSSTPPRAESARLRLGQARRTSERGILQKV
jgi:voltage-gated potassium channel